MGDMGGMCMGGMGGIIKGGGLYIEAQAEVDWGVQGEGAVESREAER
jgi:hypothetical protein